jgi:propionate CoA-transferase
VGGLKTSIANGEITIEQEGKNKKFNLSIEGITLNADVVRQNNQRVFFITERAVFELGETGIALKEIAPGIDLQRDILNILDFEIQVSKDLKIMDSRIFRPERMGIELPPA